MANTIPQGIAANQRTVSTPANNAAGVPSSRLQDQFSQLLKPQNGNVQHGTKRNDTLQGGKGNDQLYGYAGNDVLNGGDGNDYLDGGVGNDTLRGGRGNDTLQGGAGDDLMVDNSGSNTFRGGEGTDTIRLSGKFSDYTITALGNNGIMPAIYPPRPVETGFQLVDKRTGETQTVYSTENFKFADMSLDAKALGSKIDPHPTVDPRPPIDLLPPIDLRPPLDVTTMACGEEGDCFGDWIDGTPRPMPMNFDLNVE